MKNALYLITARGGSKGIPGKNIKLLGDKPLITYSIDMARVFTGDENICVSTDDDKIIAVVEEYGLKIPFKRPEFLATDEASSYDVVRHAYNFYSERGLAYDVIVLLQPTSPFRKKSDMENAWNIYNAVSVDAVLSVKEASANPYYDIYEEENGVLIKSKIQNSTRRQDAPEVYQLNGAIYVINANSLLKYPSIFQMPRLKKVKMDDFSSVDVDRPFDWLFCEYLLDKSFVKAADLTLI